MPITPLPPADFGKEFDNANFAPAQGSYTGQGTFRYWCQTALPLVYDDSLSYYELLNKIVVYLNNVITDVTTMEDNVSALHGSYLSLQNYVNENFDELTRIYSELEDYVNTYFSSLDVQTEINNKLDAMADDGTLSTLIAPIAPDIITEWLNEHITPTSPIVDDTLTISGAAADSKITGDNVYGLKALNSYNILHDFGLYRVGTSNGVGYIWDEAKTVCTATGTATNNASISLLYSNTTALPEAIEKDHTYHVNVTTTNDGLRLQIYLYYNNNTSQTYNFTSDGIIYVSNDVVGCIVRVNTINGRTVNNDTIKVTISDSLSNKKLEENINETNEEVKNIKKVNAYDMLPEFSRYQDNTSNGVTYTWNENKTVCTATGTATSNASINLLYSNTTALPESIVPGNTYYIKVTTSNTSLRLQIYLYFSNNTSNSFAFTSYGSLNVPQNTVGCVIRINTVNGGTVNNDTISVSFSDSLSNQTLSSIAENTSKTVENLKKVNAYDLLPDFATYQDRTSHGVTYTWNENKTVCTATGTATSNASISLLYSNTTALPESIIPGNTYYIKATTSNTSLRLQIYLYFSDNTSNSFAFTSDGSLNVPQNTVGCVIRINTINGGTVNNDTISVSFSLGMSNGELTNYITKTNNDIIEYNSYNLIDYSNGVSGTVGGITYTRNQDNTWTITGTVPEGTDFSFRNILYYDPIPDFIIPGRKYKVFFSETSNVQIQYFIFYENSTSAGFTVLSGDMITIPQNTRGFLLRFRILSGATVNETFKISLISVPLVGGSDSGETIINQEIHNDTFNNSYNINVNPNITTSTNNWLQPVDDYTTPESSATDMTSAIMGLLTTTGYCHLAPGVYYVSGNIDMPDGSMIEGCGYDTEIILLSNITNGYAIKMEKFNAVKDVKINGSLTDLPYNDFTANKGTRHGIIFNSEYSEGTNETEYCTINNVFITNFNGCGIKCYNTSIATHRGLYGSHIDIKRCQTGIFIEYHSEFNKFMNVNTRYCYIGCENDGGNNMFIGCTFHATNTGFLLDNSAEDKPNNGHGSVIGCTFCHIGNNSGTGISIKNTTNGFTFSDCQVWYCSIHVENSYGITFNNFEFGRGIPINGSSAKGATIEIGGGGTTMFTGCIFMNDVNYPPTFIINNNDKVKINSCYGSHSGNVITL